MPVKVIANHSANWISGTKISISNSGKLTNDELPFSAIQRLKWVKLMIDGRKLVLPPKKLMMDGRKLVLPPKN